MRVIGSRVVSSILVAAVGCAGVATTLAAQSPFEGFSSLGDLFGSFFTKASYVGAAPVSLARLGNRRSRIQLHGFSIVPPAGPEWYLAYSTYSSANTVQTVWFVKDPHLYSAYAKGDRIGARPSSLIAKLQFYGNAADQDFAARVKAVKAAEFAGDLAEVLALDVRAIRLGALGCAEYEGRVVDRGAPPGFLQQPFVVTVSGRACPHPDADGFAVDVSLMQRTREGEPLPDRDPAGDAFAQSLHLDAFDGPVVQDILLMDRPERVSRAPGVWVENTMLGAGSLWVVHRHPSARPALKWLTRIDTASNQLVARRPVDGNLAGSSGSSVWLFEPGGSARPDGTIETTTAWRLDENASDAVSVPVSCAPGRPVPWSAFQVGAFGAWLGCQTPLERGKSVPSWRVERRLDPLTGAPLAEFAIAPGPVHGDSRLVWAEETSVSQSKPCRVHAIDPATNKLVRTLALGSSECRHLAIVGNDAWLAGTNDSVMKFDLTSGRAVYSARLPRGRYALGLAVAGDAVWVSTMPSADSDVAGLQLGSEGGLVRFDCTTGAMVGRMLPTGTANRLIGVADNRVWMYDSEGAIVRVRIN